MGNLFKISIKSALVKIAQGIGLVFMVFAANYFFKIASFNLKDVLDLDNHKEPFWSALDIAWSTLVVIVGPFFYRWIDINKK